MRLSTDRILTTHVGSLARPWPLLETLREKEHGRPYEGGLLDQQIRDGVAGVIRRRAECGLDVVADGEMSKVSFLNYVKDRLRGFEPGGGAPARPRQAPGAGRSGARPPRRQ